MDLTQEMVSLKKAYAEMILNTTKEAAVRVMAAENKALKFEKELVSTKEEAVRMLLRLKHMFDTQKKESEATSLNDQKRINELEAQLDEAEGVIIDLRAKLNHVEDQLESMKDKYKRSMSRKEVVYVPNHDYTSMDTQSYFMFPYSASMPEPSPIISQVPVSFPIPSILVHDSRTVQEDVTITVENKEPELFDNDCLQSVEEESESISLQKPSTYDQESLMSSKEIVNSTSSVSASPTIESNGKECIQKSLAIKTCLPEDEIQIPEEIKCVPKSDPKPKKKKRNGKKKSLYCLRRDKSDKKESSDRQPVKEPPEKFNKLLRRTIRYGRVKPSVSNRKSAKIVIPHRTRVAFTRCKSPGSSSKSESGLNEKLKNIKKYDSVSDVRRSLRQRKTNHSDTLDKSSTLNDNLVECQVIACQDVPKKNVKKAFVNEDDTLAEHEEIFLNFLENDDNLIDVVITEQPNGLVASENTCTVDDANTCVEHEENSVCGGNSNSLEDDDVNLIDVLIVEQLNGLGSDTKLENTYIVPVDHKISEPNNPRAIIHTFSRKRKNRSLIPTVEVNSSEEPQPKKQLGEGHDIVLASGIKNVADESSEDHRISMPVPHLAF